jgi:hypothetical protein
MMMIPKWEPAIPSLSDYIYHRPGLPQKLNDIYIVTTPPFLPQQTNALSEPPTKQSNREFVYGGVCLEVVGWTLWLTRRLRIRLCFATAVYHEQHRIYL